MRAPGGEGGESGARKEQLQPTIPEGETRQRSQVDKRGSGVLTWWGVRWYSAKGGGTWGN